MRRSSLRVVLVLVLLLAAWVAGRVWDRGLPAPAPGSGAEVVAEAFGERRSGLMVEVAAEVERLLPDDNDGSRHQRFIVRLATGQTLLISHNIDLAERVPLAAGDEIEVRGQYEWNQRGGLLHWTHHDPQGRRPGGWIRHLGETYR